MALSKRELWSSFAAFGDPKVGFDQLGLKEPRPAAARKPRTCPSEWREQAMLCKAWAEYAPLIGLDVRLLYAVPNGAFLQGNAQDRAVRASMMKSAGMRSGVPDMVLAVARKGYHSLYGEVKALDGSVSPEQKEVHALLVRQGFCVQVWYGAARGFDRIREYLA